MFTILKLYLFVSIMLLVVSFLADRTDKKLGAESWYHAKKEQYVWLQVIDKASPLRPLRWLIRLALRYPRISITLGVLIVFHFILHIVNPYAAEHQGDVLE